MKKLNRFCDLYSKPIPKSVVAKDLSLFELKVTVSIFDALFLLSSTMVL